MTCLNDFTRTECPKIDPLDVGASFELSLDPINEATLKLTTSWGCTAVDLTPAIKFSETITHLFITPEGNLQFNREDYGRDGVEDGGVDCITGDALSRIISMRLLKDVDQTQQIKDGMVYMWNGITNLFEPWDLKTFATNTNNTLATHEANITNLQADVNAINNTLQIHAKRLTNLETRMTNAENRITALEADVADLQQRVGAIEGAIYNWSSDKTTKIARGNINLMGGTSTAPDTSKGIFTHNPNNTITGDQYTA